MDEAPKKGDVAPRGHAWIGRSSAGYYWMCWKYPDTTANRWEGGCFMCTDQFEHCTGMQLMRGSDPVLVKLSAREAQP